MRIGSNLPTKQGLQATGSNPLILRGAIIGAVLLLSALIAWRGPSGRLALLLIGIGPAFVGLLIYFKRPPLGMVVLLFSALLIPLNIGTGTGTALNPVILLVPVLTALWLSRMMLRQKSIRLHRHGSVYLILALNGVVVLSWIVGQLPWYSMPVAGLAAQLGGLMVFVISSAAFLVAAHMLNERWLVRLVYLFLAIGTLVVAMRLLPPLGGILGPLVDRGAQGAVFWTWLVALSAGLGLFHRGLDQRARLALLGLAALAILINFVRGGDWASGWAPPALALLLLIVLRYPRWGWIFLFAAVLLFTLEFDRFWTLATDNEAWLARRQAWQIVLDTASVNPLLGLGPSNYYFLVQRASIMGWGGIWNVRFSSHNNWVDLVAQTGIIGAGLFVFFAISLWRAGWRLYRELPFGFARAYAAACLAGLVATLASGFLGDWFLPFVYNIGLAGLRSSILFWVFLGGLLSLFVSYRDQLPVRSG